MSTSASATPPLNLPRASRRSIAGWIVAHPFRAFGLLTLFYVFVTAVLSSLKLLWFDELITVNVAHLGSASTIWHALSTGADPNPPLEDLLVLASARLFGWHEYAYRLPAMIGYWAGLLGVFLFLKRRVTPTWAITGVLICMGMGGFEWSFDSRSYALFFGTTMLALVAWSVAVDPLTSATTRRRALVGLTLALATGLCANYFSVLAFVPIGLGELTRTVGRARPAEPARRFAGVARAIDWPVWLALLIAATPLLAFHAAIQRNIVLYQPYAWNQVSFPMTTLAYKEMVEAMLMPMAALFAFAGLIWLLSRPCDACRARLLPRPLRVLADATAHPRPEARPGHGYEVVAVLVLMLYPYLGWAVASLHGGMLSSRMVIPVCFGFAIAAACVGFRTFGQVRAAGTVTLALFLLWFMVRESYIGYSYSEQKTALYDTYRALETVDNGHEPIVVSDNMLVAPFYYYASPELKSRIYYPIDVPAIMRYRHQASGEVNLWAGRQAYGFHILPLATFQHAASKYLIVTSGDDWLVDVLNEHHYKVDYIPIDTHAEPLNFKASPVSRETPIFFSARGDRFQPAPTKPPLPEPFHLPDELPRPFTPDTSAIELP